MIHICNGILFSYLQKGKFAIYSNMDATRDSHIKWSKSERERQTPHDITYIWNLKYSTNKPIYKTETDSGTQRKSCGFPGEDAGNRMDEKFGFGICKLLHL